ncbi:hypothetical protein GCM10011365_18740 [Marinicella pacifica]|uniref:Uncharacterized protein n=1 Tax=Marinicella pacifica TaxID=1171543 RepID=A0A917CTR1_9GAMM|nr:hypothetical protein [Marinicella pacifica]GGF97540.1 hypothetical protein GCM10011365_18740 [Marinicella pacifica]
MNIDSFTSDITAPGISDPTAPRRELIIDKEDEQLIDRAIERLERSNLKTKDLYEVFCDWQTKKTLTSKRIFVSTSILVAASGWIGIDYTELSFFGLEVANGSPTKFLVFVLISIIISGLFYEISRKVDSSVRNAKIKHINCDLKNLVQPIEVLDGAMERNNIDDFVHLYFDFRSSLNSLQHDAIDVYRAVKFYKNNLSRAGIGLSLVTLIEHLIVYSIAAIAIFSLAKQLV